MAAQDLTRYNHDMMEQGDQDKWNMELAGEVHRRSRYIRSLAGLGDDCEPVKAGLAPKTTTSEDAGPYNPKREYVLKDANGQIVLRYRW
jgi:hypothetical protein